MSPARTLARDRRPAFAAAALAARSLLWILALPALLSGCRQGEGYGIDPSVVERPLPGPGTPVDAALAAAGARVFQDRCVACHKLSEGIAVGPNLRGVAERREPAWIRGMVLEPDSMLRTDSVARALLYRYNVPMIDTGIGEPEFRAVLEFLRAQPTGP